MEPTKFGKYLRGLREKANLTMRKLDALSGVSHSYISQIERGERGIPSPEILRKLAEPLGVSYPLLLKEAGYLEDGSMVINGELTPAEDLVTGTLNAFPWLGAKIDGVSFSNEQAKIIESLRKKERAAREPEITKYLIRSDITYNGHQLTDQDRQRVLDMLKALFPEYKED